MFNTIVLISFHLSSKFSKFQRNAILGIQGKHKSYILSMPDTTKMSALCCDPPLEGYFIEARTNSFIRLQKTWKVFDAQLLEERENKISVEWNHYLYWRCTSFTLDKLYKSSQSGLESITSAYLKTAHCQLHSRAHHEALATEQKIVNF